MRSAMVTFADGKLELPKEVQDELHLTDGAQMRLTLISNASMRLEKEDISTKWVPNEDWRSLQGILKGHPEHDTSEVRAEERAWELKHDERKFGPFPKR